MFKRIVNEKIRIIKIVPEQGKENLFSVYPEQNLSKE